MSVLSTEACIISVHIARWENDFAAGPLWERLAMAYARAARLRRRVELGDARRLDASASATSDLPNLGRITEHLGARLAFASWDG